MKKLFIVYLILSTAFSNGFNFSYSDNDFIEQEIRSISSQEIISELYLFPSIKKNKILFFNFFKNSEAIRLSPIFALRYSSSSFEVFKDNNIINSNLIWITPGVEFQFSKPIVLGFTGIWLQAWTRFNKHSAFGFNKESPSIDMEMFPYNPSYSFEKYFLTYEPDGGGIDFDEGEGAIAVLTPWMDVLYGKFRTRLGPFYGSNLSLSHTMPGFPQIQIRAKTDKTNFLFLIGELDSELYEIIDYSLIDESEYLDQDFILKKLRRFVINHRFDYKIKENFRIGFYEQIIVGHKISLLYLLPTMPFWSAQHSLGDTDNLQIGFDMDYIKDKNRFYFSLLMDEWAPYDTFNSNHHNWFATQIGFSRIFGNNGIYKIEYSRSEPQVYVHDFPINHAYHNSYPIGYWAGGDSEEVLMLFFYKLKNNKDCKVTFRHTIIGMPDYNVNADFLEESNLKIRTVVGVELNKSLETKIGPIVFSFKIKDIKTSNLYNVDNFQDYQLSMMYNIKY